MVDNSKTQNIALSPDEKKRIDFVNTHLLNLQEEIRIGNNVLTEIRLKLEQTIKDKEYQDGLLEIVSAQVIEKSKKATELDEAILEKVAQRSKLDTEYREQTTKISAEAIDHENRKDNLAKDELVFAQKSKKLDDSNQLLKSHRETFDSKVSKLKEVIATF